MTRTRRYTCRCGAGFTYRKQLNEHVRKEHERLRPGNSRGPDGRRCIVQRVRIIVVEGQGTFDSDD